MIAADRVSSAGVVGVARSILLVDQVVHGVLDAAKAHRRAPFVALPGVVEHDIEKDLEAGSVQRLDQVAEAGQVAHPLPALDVVAPVRREEPYRRIAPVVGQRGPRAGIEELVVGLVELEDRKQFDRGHAEIDEIRDLLDQRVEGSAMGGCRRGVPREAADMELIDHAPRRIHGGRRHTFPVVRLRIHDEALHRRPQVRPLGTRVVVRRGRIGIGDTAGVRIEQQLAPIEALTQLGHPRAVHAIAIELAGADARDERMPVVEGSVGARVELDHQRLVVLQARKQQQIDRGGALGEDRKIHTRGRDRGPNWVGLTRRNIGARARHHVRDRGHSRVAAGATPGHRVTADYARRVLLCGRGRGRLAGLEQPSSMGIDWPMFADMKPPRRLPLGRREVVRRGRVLGTLSGGELTQGAKRIGGREHADNLITVDDDGGTVTVGLHLAGDLADRCVGSADVGLVGHRVLHQQFFAIAAGHAQRHRDVAAGQHPGDLPGIQHDEMPDVVEAHAFLGVAETKARIGRRRLCGHVLANCGLWAAHGHSVGRNACGD